MQLCSCTSSTETSNDEGHFGKTSSGAQCRSVALAPIPMCVIPIGNRNVPAAAPIRLTLLRDQRIDFTCAVRALSSAVRGTGHGPRSRFADPAAYDHWLGRWQVARAREAKDPTAIADDMDARNPIYIPRNHLVEEALAAACGGDLVPVSDLLQIASDPFVARPDHDRYAEPAPDTFGPYQTFCHLTPTRRTRTSVRLTSPVAAKDSSACRLEFLGAATGSRARRSRRSQYSWQLLRRGLTPATTSLRWIAISVSTSTRGAQAPGVSAPGPTRPALRRSRRTRPAP